MTREEAKELLEGWGNYGISFEYADGFANGHDYAIESRTCENCNWVAYEDEKGDNEKRICLYLDMDIDYHLDKDFGCNRFERRNNES